MTRNLFCVVVLALVIGLLASASPVKGGYVEFGLESTSLAHSGTADTYFAFIDVCVTGATGVRLYNGSDWTDFNKFGSNEFDLETDDFSSLSDLIDDIKGAGQQLEITHGAGVSGYSFTIKGAAGAEFTAIEAKMPAPTPVITVVPAGMPPVESTVALSWTWDGNTDSVTDMCAGAEVRVGGMWEDVCDKCSDDDPVQILITDTETDIDFTGHPGPYEEIEYWMGYGNLYNISGGTGTAISGWMLDSGDELFGSDVIELFVAEDFVVVPEPMTLSFLAIGGLAALIRRKR